MSETRVHRVVVVGGGFGGLQAVLKLRRAPVEVTLVDRRNFHLFQPLTYQVATGALSPGEIAYPLRAIFKRHGNVRVLLAEVSDFDLEARELQLRPVAGVPAPRRDRLRHADRRRRLALLVLRPRRLERARRRGQVARERAGGAQPHPRRLRGGRGRARRRAARRLAHVRRRRRRPDRRRDGGPDRRARPRHAAPRLPRDRPAHGPHPARRGGRSRADDASRPRSRRRPRARCERLGVTVLTEPHRRRRRRRGRDDRRGSGEPERSRAARSSGPPASPPPASPRGSAS